MVAECLENRVKQLGYESYDQYLRGEHWKAFVALVKKPRCFCCGKSKHLQVHHHSYKNLGAELLTDVVTLCGGCHQKVHDAVKEGKCRLAEAHQRLKDGSIWKKKKVEAKNHSCEHVKLEDLETKKVSLNRVVALLRRKGLLNMNGTPTSKAIESGACIVFKGVVFWSLLKFWQQVKEDKKGRKAIHVKGSCRPGWCSTCPNRAGKGKLFCKLCLRKQPKKKLPPAEPQALQVVVELIVRVEVPLPAETEEEIKDRWLAWLSKQKAKRHEGSCVSCGKKLLNKLTKCFTCHITGK